MTKSFLKNLIFPIYPIFLIIFFNQNIFSQDTIKIGKDIHVGKIIKGNKTGEWKVFDDKGLSKILNYKNGVLEGEFKSFYVNGNLYIIGHHKKGLRYGTWIDFFENKDTSYIKNYQNGSLEGKYKSFIKGNFLISEGFMKNNKENGIWISYYPNSKIILAKVNYIDGTKEGLSMHYYRNEELQSIENYKKGLLEGEKITFFSKELHKNAFEENIIKKLKFKIISNDTLYVKVQEVFVNNLKEGASIEYKENGEIIKSNYINNKKNGFYEHYHPNGKLFRTREYSNDVIQNSSPEYYENGRTFALLNYKDGSLNGRYQKFYENGNILESGNYIDDLKDGIIKWYYEDGNIKTIHDSEKGHLTGEYIEYYKNGQVKHQGKYYLGGKIGKWIYFNENGEVIDQIIHE